MELLSRWRQWPCNTCVKGGSVRRLPAVFALLSLALLASTTARTQQRDATHGRDAEPDYARVFAQDAVKRLDIRVTAADWERLVADMTEMAGPQGAMGGAAVADSTSRPIRPPSPRVAAAWKAIRAPSESPRREAAVRCCPWGRG
jgi:hypothetical protein